MHAHTHTFQVIHTCFCNELNWNLTATLVWSFMCLKCSAIVASIPQLLFMLRRHPGQPDQTGTFSQTDSATWYLFTITGGSCHKYHFCRDKHFVATNTCLSWQNTSFVTTKLLLWRLPPMIVYRSVAQTWLASQVRVELPRHHCHVKNCSWLQRNGCPQACFCGVFFVRL